MHHARIRIKFLGGLAGDNLTGSCILLTIDKGKRTTRILIDAGLIQCSFRDFLEKNQEILAQIKLDKIDFIILTHSHIDHIGRLPLFVNYNFKGRIICTEWTKKLLAVMLEDSAKIQLADIERLNTKTRKEAVDNSSKKQKLLSCGNYDRLQLKKKKNKQKNVRVHPLYTIDDVADATALVKNGGQRYYEWERLAHNIDVKLYSSGHVIGGSIVVLRIKDEPEDMHFCFTGDLGPRDGIILPPPVMVEESINYYITESTYGGSSHPARNIEIERLMEIINGVAKNNQRLIIPSFALERTQDIIEVLSLKMWQKEIPFVPIYLNSPLAIKITNIYAQGWEERGMFADQGKLSFNPFDISKNPYLRTLAISSEAEILASQPKSGIFISSSGMCEAGPVRNLLRINLPKKDAAVCLIGYMAKNSLGRKLKELTSPRKVMMNGSEILVQAEIHSFESFSAHADGPFLVDYATEVLTRYPNLPKYVFIVHGEGEGAENFKADLESGLSSLSQNINIMIPKLNEEFVLK